SAGAHHREIIHHRHRLDVVGESWFRTKRRVRTTGQGFFFIAPSRRGGPESTTHETGDCFHHRARVGAPLAGDVERRAVTDRGKKNRRADGEARGALRREQLRRDVALVV